MAQKCSTFAPISGVSRVDSFGVTILLALSSFADIQCFDSGLLEEVRYERDSLTALIAYGLVRITPLCLFALYLTSRLLLLRPQDEVSSRAKRRAERRQRRLEEKRVRADKGKGLRKRTLQPMMIPLKKNAQHRDVERRFF